MIVDVAPDAVMLEESKKAFVLDPAEIRKELPASIVLFGNLDSQLLLRGTEEDVRRSICEQGEALAHGRFVFVNGSPICPSTPPDNLRAFMDAARSLEGR